MDRKVTNDVTLPARVLISWLKSFFKHDPDFDYNDDESKTKIVVASAGADLGNIKENIDRVIIARRNFESQVFTTDNRVEYNNKMYTYSVIKPKLGYVDIFCESINDVQADYIASKIETALTIHHNTLLEMNVGIGPLSISDVRKPYSGSRFFSIMVAVPTMVVGKTVYTVKDPQMLQNIGIEFGIGNPLD
ncbi:MAG: hypothetical protein WCY30_00075 [Candidatus Neomarinimicrobiota bacterium]